MATKKKAAKKTTKKKETEMQKAKRKYANGTTYKAVSYTHLTLPTINWV